MAHPPNGTKTTALQPKRNATGQFVQLQHDALSALEKEIGGRAHLQAALVQAPPSAGLDFVINALTDPTTDHRTLSSICDEAGVTIGEVIEGYKRGVMAKGTVSAVKAIAEGAAPVTQDVMRRAAPYEETCPACDGTKSVTAEPTEAEPNPAPEPCEACRGTGVVKYLPDLARQKMALDLVGLLGQKTGTQINIMQANQQVTAAANGERGALAKLQAATDRILTPLTPADLRAAEGEVVGDGES